MQIKHLIVLVISILILNACGVKGPVKPVKTKSPTGNAIPTDHEPAEKTESCGN